VRNVSAIAVYLTHAHWMVTRLDTLIKITVAAWLSGNTGT